jgi:hypothetical protein
MPLLLKQCRVKTEDVDKFRRDQLYAEVLEKKLITQRSTIRSKAAKTIEMLTEKYQKEVFFAMRSMLEKLLNSKQNMEDISSSEIHWSNREAAILVIGVIGGYR